MAEYFVNSKGLIHHEGKVYRSGNEIELTDEQAEALKAYVIKKEVATADLKKDQTVKELRSLAKEAGIENYSSMDKAQLKAELQAVQAGAEVVSDNESTNG